LVRPQEYPVQTFKSGVFWQVYKGLERAFEKKGKQLKFNLQGGVGLYTLRLYQDRFQSTAKTTPHLEGQHSFIYIVEGSAFVNGQLLEKDEAVYSGDTSTIEAGPNGAEVWRWEVVRTSESNNLARGESIKSHLRMSRQIKMFELVPTSKWLFRLDSVLDHEGSTGLHFHPGSGIRCLVHGNLLVESEKGECSNNRQPGDAWYEEGAYPVISTADEGVKTTFVRGMILPPEFVKYPQAAQAVWIEGAKSFKSHRKTYLHKIISLW
jgi:hypothetical protein